MTLNHIEKLQQLRSVFFEAFAKIDVLKIDADIERLVFDRSTFLNQINSEILRSGSEMTTDDGSNNNNNVDEIDDEQAAISMELELAEKAAAELLVNRRQEIASRFNRDVESFGASSLPVLHRNFGKKNAYTHFLSSTYTPEGYKQLLASDPKQAGTIMKQKALVWKSLEENVKKWWKDEAHKFNIANHLSDIVTKGSMETRYWQLISCLNRNISLLRSECGVESACILAAGSHEPHKSVQPSSNGYGSIGGVKFMNDLDTDAVKFSPSTMINSFRVEMINFNRQLEQNIGTSAENIGSNVVLVDVSASKNGSIHVRRPGADVANANRSTLHSSQHADNYEISKEAVDKVDPRKTRKRFAAYSERRMHKKVKLVNWPSDIDCKRPSDLTNEDRATILMLTRTNNESRRIRYEPITEVQSSQEQVRPSQEQVQQLQTQQLQQQIEQEEQRNYEEEEEAEQRLQALMQELERTKQQ
ncbi:hypothetical protein INT45_009801 [Circinella minor]|uniref:Uncharacterized protein n=1 Tax=Circinella minor TaxID=1195481 RepID=A0A8H7RRA9_9FUNG|nr:hypothetical protein INT45_009801 [Circinella minor]